MILLQTLVMSVILSMISVMVMQWVLGRYMIAARTYRSSVSKVRSQGCSFHLLSNWNFHSGIPAGINCNRMGAIMSYTVSGSRVTITSDEDQ